MKAVMILGALVGFVIGTGFGLAGSSPWPSTLWRACAAALVAAVLARWWSSIWMKSLRESLEQREAARRAPATPLKPAKQ